MDLADLPVSLRKTLELARQPDDDPLARSTLSKENHNNLMDRLEKFAAKYDRLAVQFCIPDNKVAEIQFDTRDAWGGLNAVVSEWLKWNLDKKAKECHAIPNRRWLVEAVRVLDEEDSKKMEEEFKLLALDKDKSKDKDKELEEQCNKVFQDKDKELEEQCNEEFQDTPEKPVEKK